MTKRMLSLTAVIASLASLSAATIMLDSFDIRVHSSAALEGNMYRYSYLVYAADNGPEYIHKGLSHLDNIYPTGEAAVDSVDWTSLQLWTNLGDPAAWLALFQHGYLYEPVTDSYYWGVKIETPDGLEFAPDGDGISFEETDPYDWAGYPGDLLTHAEDPDDPYFAYSFLSCFAPCEGTWLAKDGAMIAPDTGTKLVPCTPIPEPGSLTLLVIGLVSLGAIARTNKY